MFSKIPSNLIILDRNAIFTHLNSIFINHSSYFLGFYIYPTTCSLCANAFSKYKLNYQKILQRDDLTVPFYLPFFSS